MSVSGHLDAGYLLLSCPGEGVADECCCNPASHPVGVDEKVVELPICPVTSTVAKATMRSSMTATRTRPSSTARPENSSA